VPFKEGGGGHAISPKNTNPNKYLLNLSTQKFFSSEIKTYIMLLGEMGAYKKRRVQGQPSSST